MAELNTTLCNQIRAAMIERYGLPLESLTLGIDASSGTERIAGRFVAELRELIDARLLTQDYPRTPGSHNESTWRDANGTLWTWGVHDVDAETFYVSFACPIDDPWMFGPTRLH